MIQTDMEDVRLIISEMTWVITSAFLRESKSAFFVMLLINSKPVTGKKEVRKERRNVA